MMKRKKRILIGGSIVLIAAICGAIFLFSGKTQPTKSLAKQVEEDYTGIEEIINQAVENNDNLAMSSNPYEYVKNNSYYDRLVSKGISILPILEKKINENQYGDGLLGYITAIAIEDITECNLKEDKDLQWATVSEFGDSWKKFKKTAKEKIDALINSKLDETVKVKQLKKYGVYAAAVLKEQKLEEKFPKIVKMHPINKNEYDILEKELQ